MNFAPRRLTAALCLLLCVSTLGLAGCGYQHHELFPDEVSTIAVPAFENRTIYRDVQYDLREALIKQIEQRTPYKVVPVAAADTILQGALVAVERDLLTRTRDAGLPQTVEVTLVTDFQWKELRGGGDLLLDRRGFEAVGRFVPATPVSQPFEVAQHTAVEDLADQIVSEMRADW
ncbi:MAG: LPS assembly lipoprotein LptE [Phycisphaeraceae bacterium]